MTPENLFRANLQRHLVPDFLLTLVAIGTLSTRTADVDRSTLFRKDGEQARRRDQGQRPERPQRAVRPRGFLPSLDPGSGDRVPGPDLVREDVRWVQVRHRRRQEGAR